MNVASVTRPLRTSAQVSSGIRRQVAEFLNWKLPTVAAQNRISFSRCTSQAAHVTCTPRALCTATWTPQQQQVVIVLGLKNAPRLCSTSKPQILRKYSVVSCLQRFSSNQSNIGKGCEIASNDSGADDWNHPASRTEDLLSRDPELRSILSEIASDFGKSPASPIDSERTEAHTEREAAAGVESNSVEGSARDVKEGFVAMTTEHEPKVEGESMETVEVSSVEACRSASESTFVFSIDDVVEILREENAQDICVIAVPPEKNYVDYFIVVTGRSSRHLSAMTQFINKLYKNRKGKDDPFLIVEGKLVEDWMCLDFGNIVVHFMLADTRAAYNLEELWTMGKEFDSHIQRWDQHEVLLFNPETDLSTTHGEQEETQEE